LATAAISSSQYAWPKDGIDNAPSGVRRLVPPITICATFVALGSFTAALPVSVANGETALSPVQPWQLTQAPSKIFLPRRLAVTPNHSGADAPSPAFLRGPP
jgi:hypothetical protein